LAFIQRTLPNFYIEQASYILLSQNKPVLAASGLVIYSMLSSHPLEDLQELGGGTFRPMLFP